MTVSPLLRGGAWAAIITLALSGLAEAQNGAVGPAARWAKLLATDRDAGRRCVGTAFTVDAIHNYSDASGATLSSDATTESDGLRARIEGGFNYTDRRGAQLSMSANYDGIGQSDYESYGISVKVTVPLQ